MYQQGILMTAPRVTQQLPGQGHKFIRRSSLFIDTGPFPAPRVTRAGIPGNMRESLRLTVIHVMQMITGKNIQHAHTNAPCVITAITGVTRSLKMAVTNEMITIEHEHG